MSPGKTGAVNLALKPFTRSAVMPAKLTKHHVASSAPGRRTVQNGPIEAREGCYAVINVKRIEVTRQPVDQVQVRRQVILDPDIRWAVRLHR